MRATKDHKQHNNSPTDSIVANRPYLGGTVPIFYAKFPTVPIFLDCAPIFLNSLNVQNSAILSPNLIILAISLNVLIMSLFFPLFYGFCPYF